MRKSCQTTYEYAASGQAGNPQVTEIHAEIKFSIKGLALYSRVACDLCIFFDPVFIFSDHVVVYTRLDSLQKMKAAELGTEFGKNNSTDKETKGSQVYCTRVGHFLGFKFYTSRQWSNWVSI